MIWKILIAVLIGPAVVAVAEVVRPLESQDSWVLPDPQAWKWEDTEKGPALVLEKQSDFTSEVRRPRNLAWFDARKWGAFTLTAEVRLDLFNDGNNDLCIAFGQSSESRFYYAHLGQSADAVHLHLHLVEDADRRAITQKRAETLPWKPGHWHQVKLARDPAAGTILVWFDGVEVLSANDKTLGEGRIGLGSFDDLGAFRAVEVVEGVAEDP